MKFLKSGGLSVIALTFAFLLLSCSGGGGGSNSVSNGGGAVTALTVANKVSVVSAQTGTNSAKPGIISALLLAASLPASTSDYYTDKTNVWVAERTSDAFNTINDILCMMSQTKYDAMLNKGAYTALVDQNVCKSNSSDPAAAGQQAQNQSSSADMPNYMTFTVDSSRTDNNSPEIVRVWVHQPASDNDTAALIFGKATITEGASSSNPYGIFTMDFAGYNVDATGAATGSARFTGTLRAHRDNSGKVLLDFVSKDSHADCGGTESSVQQVALDRLPDGSAGAGLIYQNSTGACGSQTINFDFAYNTADFWRKDLISVGTPTACLSRTKFSESSWSYGLYDMSGARVTRNSGFPITFTAPEDGASHRGYVSNWGVWIENNNNNTITLHNGQTVTQNDYRTNTTTNYTVFKAGGKLKKHTQQTLALNDIKNIPLNYWEQLESCGTGTNYQVVFGDPANTGTTTFYKTAQMPPNCNGNCTWQTIPAAAIDLSNLTQGNLNFWSDSLGGQAQVQLISSGTPTCTQNTDNTCTTCRNAYTLPSPAAQSVIFYAEQLVYPGDTVPASLACYDQCPKAGASGVDPNDVYYNNLSSGQTTTTNYTFDNTNLMLMDGLNSVVSTTTGTNQQIQWGVMSGALIDPTPANVALLACPWNSSQVCGWQAWSKLQTFYTWETGPDTWNQFIGVKNAGGTFVKFDPPLQITYVHHQPDSTMSDYIYNGVTFMLQYGGFGQLNGIPSYCVDMDTGNKVDCSQSNSSNSIRWVPQFTIPALQVDGSLTVATDSSSIQYFVKPLEIEQRMAQDATAGACGALASTSFSSYTLPDISIWTDPKAVEPTVTAAPAVIGGVVQ